VRDTRRNCDGVVMAAVGTYVQLRPLDGGVERDVKPEDIRPLTAREELSARLAVRNAATRRGAALKWRELYSGSRT
jgi:hypothetical protein